MPTTSQATRPGGMVLFDEAGQTLEEMIAEVSACAAAFERAWFERRFGFGSVQAELNTSLALSAARQRVRDLIPDEGQTVTLTESGAALAA